MSLQATLQSTLQSTFPDNWIDVRSFAPPGTPRDGMTPWDSYIQAAIDSIINADSQPGSPETMTIYLPPGKYLLNNPIRIAFLPPAQVVNGVAQPQEYAYVTMELLGNGSGYSLEPSELIAAFPDLPAVIVQAGQGVRIKDLTITGQNGWQGNLTATELMNFLLSDDDSGFVTGGVKDSSRHAPYAGICIDPFCSPIPSDFYSKLQSSYQKSAGSGQITIERCFIQKFVVGIMITPNDQTQNAENIFINDCVIGNTKSAIAVGQTQSRALSCSNLSVNSTKYAIDCTHYGRGGGNCPSIFNANIGQCRFLFSTFSSGSGASINGLYCESTKAIGTLGGAGTNGPSDGYSFNGCAFNLMGQSSGPYTDYHLHSGARAAFNECGFNVADLSGAITTALPLFINNGGLLSFRNCSLNTGADVGLPFWINDNANPDRITFDNTSIGMPSQLLGLQPTIFSQHLGIAFLSNMVNQYMLPGCFFFPTYTPDGGSPRWVAGGLRRILLGTVANSNFAVDQVNNVVTFQADPGTVAVGDFIHSDALYLNVVDSSPTTPVNGVIGKVVSVTNNPTTQKDNVTLKFVPAYVIAAGSSVPNPSAANLWVVSYYKVHSSTTGKVNPNSNMVSINSPLDSRIWLPGDRVRGQFIPDNTYVTSVDTTASTLTLSKNVSSLAAPNQQVNLFDADVRAFSTTPVF